MTLKDWFYSAALLALSPVAIVIMIALVVIVGGIYALFLAASCVPLIAHGFAKALPYVLFLVTAFALWFYFVR